jgi:hypothetical protein
MGQALRYGQTVAQAGLMNIGIAGAGKRLIQHR